MQICITYIKQPASIYIRIFFYFLAPRPQTSFFANPNVETYRQKLEKIFAQANHDILQIKN